MKKNNNNRGFTLLELLVVMVIIGVLVTIGLRSFTQSQIKSRDAKRKSDIEQLERALELYRGDKGHYPVSNEFGQMVVFWEDGGTTQEQIFEWGEPFYDPVQPSTIYMPKLPTPTGQYTIFYQAYVRDPSQESGFSEAQYPVDEKAQAYRIYTVIENPQDPAIMGAMNVDCHAGSGTAYCNFAVSSSNLMLEYDFLESGDGSYLTGGGEDLLDGANPTEPVASPSATSVPSEPTNTPMPTNTPTPTNTPEPSPTPQEGYECACLSDPPICPGGSYQCIQYEGGGCGWQCNPSGDSIF